MFQHRSRPGVGLELNRDFSGRNLELASHRADYAWRNQSSLKISLLTKTKPNTMDGICSATKY